jgi:pimeloyl-ACP methyl ester carboxylesterase
MLADRLALAGYPTIRFSYPGTGDSRDPQEANWWPAWIASVHSAIDTALALPGVRRVVLFGVRLGAALAALAASERPEVVGIVLLEPVVRGSSFVMQLRVEERVSARGVLFDHDSVRVHGLDLTTEALEGISGLDLRSFQLNPGSRVLVLSDQTSAALQACLQSWSSQGVPVVHERADEVCAFFRPTHLADEPFPVPTSLLRWFRTNFPASTRAFSIGGAIEPPALKAPGWTETPHRFGAAGHLFGILCEPSQPARGDRVVLIGNGGGDPHEGFARFAVEFARILARHGVASLRMDFAGLGDSVNAMDDIDGLTHPFTVDRRPDFAAAVDFVWARGFRRIALQGLCSGAYHALQAAVADRRVSVLLCVNLPWFSLRYERAGPTSFAQHACDELAARSVRCLLLFNEDDAGLKPLEQHFGPSGRDLAALPGFDVVIRPDLDHDLTRPEMRRLAADQMMLFLSQEPLAAGIASLRVRHLLKEGAT